MIEPGTTALSRPFYIFLHHEPVDMSNDPLADQPSDVAADPFHRIRRYLACSIGPIRESGSNTVSWNWPSSNGRSSVSWPTR